MQFLNTIVEETTFEDTLNKSNSEREQWVEELVFYLYGKQKNKDISKKWSRKLFTRSLKTVYVHAEIETALLAINILLQHQDCSFEEILGAFQILLLNKLEQGKKMNLSMPAELNNLIEICENVKKLNLDNNPQEDIIS